MVDTRRVVANVNHLGRGGKAVVEENLVSQP
jgi:hypothetical protein